MRKIKTKRGAFWQAQMLPFVIMWTISVGLVAVFSRFLQILPLPFLYNEPQASALLSFLISGLGTGVVQVLLVERLLKKPMRGWMLYTAASLILYILLDSFLSTYFFVLYQAGLLSFEIQWQISRVMLYAPTPLLQALWLHKRIRRAWLWPLVTIPLLTAFTAVPYGQENYQLLKLVTLLCVGVVQAGLMHSFWQNPREDDKAGIDAAEEADDARIQRLQEKQASTPLWNTGDEQALQSETL